MKDEEELKRLLNFNDAHMGPSSAFSFILPPSSFILPPSGFILTQKRDAQRQRSNPRGRLTPRPLPPREVALQKLYL